MKFSKKMMDRFESEFARLDRLMNDRARAQFPDTALEQMSVWIHSCEWKESDFSSRFGPPEPFDAPLLRKR